MPYVNIRVAGELSLDQKRQISKDISNSLQKVANKPKESILIIFDEIKTENVAKGDAVLYDLLQDKK